jgi:hypothetical protein
MYVRTRNDMKVKYHNRMCMYTCMYVLIDKQLFTTHYLNVCMYVCRGSRGSDSRRGDEDAAS